MSTLDQLTTQFASVKVGLPELVKNSKDQYSRLHIFDENDRQIVVLLSTASRRLAVLDFAGAPLSNFEGWTVWSDPTAGKAELAADIEAGHGNGGKAFMVRGATEFAYMESCYEGRRTRKGFRNSLPQERYKPGYAVEGGQPISAMAEMDPRRRLEQFLGELGMRLTDIPEEALAAFNRRNAYTGVLLSKVTDWARKHRGAVVKLAREMIPEIVTSHGQTALSIETCKVWVVVDGNILNDGQPIKPIPLEPYNGFEPRVLEIPDILPDPEGYEGVDTVKGLPGERKLILNTSGRHLRISSDTKARNVIRVRNGRNNVATWPLPSLGILPASIAFIHGELHCPALSGEHLAGADRLHLANTPLTRALRHWTTAHVRELADDLHQAMLSDSKPGERKQARTALSGIRDLMRKFLEPDSDGWVSGAGGNGPFGLTGNGLIRHRHGTKFAERIDQIELENSVSDLIVVQGTTIPLHFRCLEVTDGQPPRPVRAVGLRLHNSEALNWEFDAQGNLTPHEHGIAEIWLETEDGAISSNRVEVWVAHATTIEAELPTQPLKQGQSVTIPFVFQTDEGPLQDTLLDARVLEEHGGTIGRKGRFKAGNVEGQVTIRVRYGPEEQSCRDFQLQIGSEKIPPPPGQAGGGSDVPLILFCGDEAPNRDDLPADQRTLPGGPESPTIIEDPMFPSVVWINDSSKEAIRVRKSKGGSSGIGRISSRNFIHFLALKCFDILKRLYVRQRIAGGNVTEYQYILYAMEAEIDCADFIDAAWELSEDLLRGGENLSA